MADNQLFTTKQLEGRCTCGIPNIPLEACPLNTQD